MKNLIVLAVALIAVGAEAQVKVNQKLGRPENFQRVSPNRVGLNRMDKEFMKKTALSNLFEIKLGEFAAKRGGSPWSRSYGREMAYEHSLAQSQLKQLAHEKGVDLPNKLPTDKRKILVKMTKLYGPAFDREFRRIQLAAHETAMKLQAKEIEKGWDAQVRSLATMLLATSRQHHMLAVNRDNLIVRQTFGSAAQPMRP